MGKRFIPLSASVFGLACAVRVVAPLPAQTLPPSSGRQQITARPAAPLPLRPLPAPMESRALEIFNGVSPEARSWILEEARKMANNHQLSAEAIGSAANQRLGRKSALAKPQQDALAVAVLYQVMKLDQQEYRSKTEQLRILAASNSSTSKTSVVKQTTPAPRGNGNPATGSGDLSQSLQFQLQTTMDQYNQAQQALQKVLKELGEGNPCAKC